MLWKVADRLIQENLHGLHRCRMRSFRYAGKDSKRCICWRFPKACLCEFYYEFGDPALKFHGFIEISDEHSQYMDVRVNRFEEAAEIYDVVKDYSDRESDEPMTTPWKARLVERGIRLLERFKGRDYDD